MVILVTNIFKVMWLLEQIREYLVLVFKQQFSVFKQYYTYFHTFFHPHVFLKNTNNVTRTTLPNRIFASWKLYYIKKSKSKNEIKRVKFHNDNFIFLFECNYISFWLHMKIFYTKLSKTSSLFTTCQLRFVNVLWKYCNHSIFKKKLISSLLPR